MKSMAIAQIKIETKSEISEATDRPHAVEGSLRET